MTNIENFDNDFSKQSTKDNQPAAVLVLDKDGNPLQVEVLGPNEVQDVEFTDEKDSN